MFFKRTKKPVELEKNTPERVLKTLERVGREFTSAVAPFTSENQSEDKSALAKG